ncbi:uncharacterized protein LOC130264898 [Oenanthe melanoleuca]|uniref:uncharacterized protein LOC130264898 n=1 Tax=Oenanthe melanoleuca TaxID=2939378 RepID=UPI0024C1D1DC|nr:uncharacterized protein LOC130264898 [Oenanthe melanoleuca]
MDSLCKHFDEINDFCIQVVVVPRILYHPDDEVLLHFDDRPYRQRRELALLERDHKQIALAEVLCQTQGELFPAREQEEQLRQRVEEQQENGQVRHQAVASGAAAATLLPSLQLEILSEEAMRGRPEAATFQHIPISFRDLNSPAAVRGEALPTGKESLPAHFEAEAAVTPPAAAPDVHFQPEAAVTPPAAPPDACWEQPRHAAYNLLGIDKPAGRTPSRTYSVPGTGRISEYFRFPCVPQGIRKPHGPDPHVCWGEPRQRSDTLSGSDIPSGGTPYRTYNVHGTDTSSEPFPLGFVSREASTPLDPAPDACWEQPRHAAYNLLGIDKPAGRTPSRTYSVPGTGRISEYFRFPCVLQGICKPRGPDPHASLGEPRQRSDTLSGSDIPSGRTPYRTYNLHGTDTTSEPFPLRFVHRRASTPPDPAPDVH